MKEIGYTFTPLKEGVKKTLSWIEQQKQKPRAGKPFTLISGASSGIGKAMAENCAEKGMDLILVSLPDQGLTELSNELKLQHNVRVEHFECDLSKRSSIDNLYSWCSSNNFSVNILINNAGMGHVGAFEQSKPEEIFNLMTINMQSLTLMTHTFLPMLKSADKGYVLNVGSLASFNPIPYKSVYSATKSFVLSFSRSLREELRSHNVSISCVCPGPTLTSPEVVRRVKATGWSGRLLAMTSEEVAVIAINGLLKKKAVIIPDWKNYILSKISMLVPVSAKMRMLGNVFRKENKKKEEKIIVEVPDFVEEGVLSKA